MTPTPFTLEAERAARRIGPHPKRLDAAGRRHLLRSRAASVYAALRAVAVVCGRAKAARAVVRDVTALRLRLAAGDVVAARRALDAVETLAERAAHAPSRWRLSRPTTRSALDRLTRRVRALADVCEDLAAPDPDPATVAAFAATLRRATAHTPYEEAADALRATAAALLDVPTTRRPDALGYAIRRALVYAYVSPADAASARAWLRVLTTARLLLAPADDAARFAAGVPCGLVDGEPRSREHPGEAWAMGRALGVYLDHVAAGAASAGV